MAGFFPSDLVRNQREPNVWGGQADQPWSKGVKDIDGFGVLAGEELQPSTKRLQHVDLMLNMGYDNLSRIPHFVGK